MRSSSTELDLENLNSSSSLAVLSVRPGSRVLALGASRALTCALRDRGCTVRVIEPAPLAAEAPLLTDDDTGMGRLKGETFDAILALDVLEHLREPAAVLAQVSRLLAPGGVVIVCVPNVTHGAVRLSLLQGRFEYSSLGLLDRRHLRFFDRRGAEDLMAEAGLLITERLKVTRGLSETEIPVGTDHLAPELLERVMQGLDATTYEFVFVGRRLDQPVELASGAMLSERLLLEIERLRSRLADAERHALELAAAHGEARVADVQRERDEYRAELVRRMGELQLRQVELKHAKADVAVKQAFIDDLRQEVQSNLAAANDRFAVLNERWEQALVRMKALEVERDRLSLELGALRTYAGSAGFRLVERVLAVLRRVPFLYRSSRAIVRAVAGPRAGRP